MKTRELTGPALDWAVAKCEGVQYRYQKSTGGDYNGNSWWETRNYSTDWAQGGPILERERIGETFVIEDCWVARFEWEDYYHEGVEGPTKLIAGLRCFVLGKLGEEVEIPKELV